MQEESHAMEGAPVYMLHGMPAALFQAVHVIVIDKEGTPGFPIQKADFESAGQLGSAGKFVLVWKAEAIESRRSYYCTPWKLYALSTASWKLYGWGHVLQADAEIADMTLRGFCLPLEKEHASEMKETLQFLLSVKHDVMRFFPSTLLSNLGLLDASSDVPFCNHQNTPKPFIADNIKKGVEEPSTTIKMKAASGKRAESAPKEVSERKALLTSLDDAEGLELLRNALEANKKARVVELGCTQQFLNEVKGGTR